MIFINVRSSSPFRITILCDTAPDLVASNYVLARVDGASTTATISLAFSVLTNTVELVVSDEPLIDGVQYLISDPSALGAPSAVVAYRQPLLQTQVPVAPAEDPEAEAFGVDIDWFADSLTASGDTPEVRGKQCLTNDLAIISLIQKGELFHRPDAGAGLQLNTNAPMSNLYAKQLVAALTREWYRDPRVRTGGVTVTASVDVASGQLQLTGTVVPLAIDDPTIVKIPGGGT